jgi:hypothetical protein
MAEDAAAHALLRSRGPFGRGLSLRVICFTGSIIGPDRARSLFDPRVIHRQRQTVLARRGPFGPGFAFPVTPLTSCRTRSRAMLGYCRRTISAPSFCPMNPPFSAMAARMSDRTSSSGGGVSLPCPARGASIGNSLTTRSRFTRTFSKSPCPVTLTLPILQTASLWKSPPTAISRPPQSSAEIACAGSPGRFPLASSFPRRKNAPNT